MQIHIANTSEKEKVFALRFEVFVDEQNVPPEIEIDEKDDNAIHIIAEEEGVTVGCARAVLSENSAYIGRIAVKKNLRGRHIGLQICRFVIDYCEEQGCKYIWLNAQVQAQGFYEKLGFKSEGEPFMEAGIEHIKMSMEI